MTIGKNIELAQLILAVVELIPYGQVASYGQIARLAGLPRHARMVGRVLSQLDVDSQVPWYRVLNSQGMISLKKYNELSENIQVIQLMQEGVVVNRGRVDLKIYQWQP